MSSPRPVPAPRSVRRAIARHSFCVLATSSAAGEAHAVGVMYAAVAGVLYVATLDNSRKARNARANARVGICIPVRRLPMAPPFVVQFQATAEVLPRKDPAVAALLAGSQLRKITSHGELDEARTCFLRLTPNTTVFTYGVGVPLSTLLRDPLHANRTFELAGGPG